MDRQVVDAVRSPARVARVFVASTYRDMHAEREQLAKHVFPELRRRCAERGVDLVAVDFRFGASEEHATRGDVLPARLAEIDRCDYFVGLLGEHYGELLRGVSAAWVQRRLGTQEASAGTSLTEVEIVCGALSAEVAARPAYFYFRDAAYVERIALEQRRDFIAESAEAQDRIAGLKQRIRASGLPVREDYADPETLGKWVLEDLWRELDLTYPLRPPADFLDHENEHEAAREHLTSAYVERKVYLDRLDQHAAADGPPLVVVGDPGAGKSALLANWAQAYRKRFPDQQVILHFVGASAASADSIALMQRILGELRRQLGLEVEAPARAAALRLAFANAMCMAAARARVVVVIDGIDAIEHSDGGPALAWLPPLIPPNVRLIVSAQPGAALDEFQHRDWPTLTVEPLTRDERRVFIEDYLARFDVFLPLSRAERIASAAQTANALFLRALLDELRVFGAHRRLDEPADYYLEAQTVDELYQRILERYEEDFDLHRPHLVRDVLALLWAARCGLTENELLELAGTDGQALPTGYWAPLAFAAGNALGPRCALIRLSHPCLRQAVAQRYLSPKKAQRAIHARLADYFEAQPLNRRQLDELPWQLTQSRGWLRLSTLFANVRFVSAAWNADRRMVKDCWAQLEANTPLRKLLAYRAVVDGPARVSDAADLESIADLLLDADHAVEAQALREHLTERYRSSSDLPRLQASLARQAAMQAAGAAWSEALKLHHERERLCRDLGDTAALADCLGAQADTLTSCGAAEEALRLYQEQEQLWRDLGRSDDLQRSLGNQGLIHYARREYEQALRLYREKETVCRAVGNHDGLQRSLGNQANIYAARGELDEALRLYREKERLCRELGHKGGLERSLGTQANIHNACGAPDKALRLLQEQERLCRELDDKAGLQRSLGNQANIHAARGTLDEALRLFEEQEQVCRELSDKKGLQRSLGNQANIHAAHGAQDEALRLYREKERLCRELGNKDGLQRSLGNQALIHYSRQSYDEALSLYAQKEKLCRELGNSDALQRSLAYQANIYAARGAFDMALRLYREQEQLCRELGNKASLHRSLGNQGVLQQSLGALEDAMRLHQEEEALCRALGDQAGLATSLGSQADICASRGLADQAMELYAEQERLYRELGNKDGLQASLGNQAAILQARGALAEAMALYREQEGLCRELGAAHDVANCLGNQGVIQADLGAQDEAMSLYQEQERLCRALGDQRGLQASLGNQANVHAARGAAEAALPLYLEKERICRALGDQRELAIALGNQGVVHADRGEFEAAMRLYQEQESLCRELADKAGLASCLGNQANILYARGEYAKAMDLYKQEEGMCRELDNKSRLAISLANQAVLLSKQADRAHEALPLVEEAHRFALDQGLVALVQQIAPILDAVRATGKLTGAVHVSDWRDIR